MTLTFNITKAAIHHVWRYKVMTWELWHVDLSVKKHQQCSLTCTQDWIWREIHTSHMLTHFHPVRSLILCFPISFVFSFFFCWTSVHACGRPPQKQWKSTWKLQQCSINIAPHKHGQFTLFPLSDSSINKQLGGSIHINKISGGTMCVCVFFFFYKSSSSSDTRHGSVGLQKSEWQPSTSFDFICSNIHKCILFHGR